MMTIYEASVNTPTDHDIMTNLKRQSTLIQTDTELKHKRRYFVAKLLKVLIMAKVFDGLQTRSNHLTAV